MDRIGTPLLSQRDFLLSNWFHENMIEANDKAAFISPALSSTHMLAFVLGQYSLAPRVFKVIFLLRSNIFKSIHLTEEMLRE
jgi:hypothetical protein